MNIRYFLPRLVLEDYFADVHEGAVFHDIRLGLSPDEAMIVVVPGLGHDALQILVRTLQYALDDAEAAVEHEGDEGCYEDGGGHFSVDDQDQGHEAH